ncbi:hypothetical protein ACH5RR_010615 [Cinchona calisaya]|uniref:Cation-transporting P-type ATPase C-terminal domain-containing protein n=1 Tax=Cinchona calisaya TaxID=153742 RepID=A0ABD3AJF3_9GENT
MSIDADDRTQFENIIQGMAASSLRYITFAHKQITLKEMQQNEDQMNTKKLKEDDLSLLGIVGIKDPCRPGARGAIKTYKATAVDIKMITGDNVSTAKAIDSEYGILGPDDEQLNSWKVIEGVEFRNYTHEERMLKVDDIRVIAKSFPFDMLLMVQCLKQKGHVVAVTGDGTNDAHTLKEVDIGLSMGIQGTEVAKESSDIVILDDDFASVATVLRWGRCVYNNIQKFIQFQLTVNVAALVINFIAAISAGDVPFTAVQLLWFKGKSIFNVNERVKSTIIFNTFVLCQVFNELNSRKLEKKNVFTGLHKNRLFIGIVGVTVLLQVVMVELLKKFADTESLKWKQWVICIAIAALSWPIGFFVKFIPVIEEPFLNFFRHLGSRSVGLRFFLGQLN